MVDIHPTAIVDVAAELGTDVVIGPFCVIEAGVAIGDGCRLGPHNYIASGVTLGAGNELTFGVMLGGPAQHRSAAPHDTWVQIGDRNVFRENVTVHRASVAGGITRVGNDNWLMATSHVGHDAVVGNNVTLSNCVALGGHCRIEDHVIMGGISAVHQRVTIGERAMIGGMSGATNDIPPYSISSGKPAKVVGLNSIGLERAGFAPELRTMLKRAIRLIYCSKLSMTNGLAQIEAEYPDPPAELARLLAFVHAAQEGQLGRSLEH